MIVRLVLQIIVALILMTVIILQAKGTSLGSVFGGNSTYHAKRGMEKSLFYLTIIFAVIFVALALVNAL